LVTKTDEQMRNYYVLSNDEKMYCIKKIPSNFSLDGKNLVITTLNPPYEALKTTGGLRLKKLELIYRYF